MRKLALLAPAFLACVLGVGGCATAPAGNSEVASCVPEKLALPDGIAISTGITVCKPAGPAGS